MEQILYDITNRDLNYAVRNGSVWSIQIVDSEGDMYCSIALDSRDNSHISYYDFADLDLK